MGIETTKMSSKGQIVIPRNIRENIQASEGSLFTIINDKDTIILKKIKTHSEDELIADFKKIAAEGKKRAEKLGIKETDVPNLINKSRKEKRK
jgi:AbrB family looped-hinge helix DNA binding protein